MPRTNELDWKKYEALTKYIYETLGTQTGVKIEGFGNNCKVTGKSGVAHQIDVLTSHSDGVHSYRTAIECKYWKEKIDKTIVMQVSEIISDTGIEKGVIVSKNGFTKDGLEYARFNGIRLVELSEAGDNGSSEKPEILDIGSIIVRTSVTMRRPEILSTIIDYVEEVSIEKEEINIYHTTVILSNGTQIPFTEYTKAFQDELHHQNKPFQSITKRYEIEGGSLFNKMTNTLTKIKSVTFAGVLKKSDENSEIEFSLVDQVWFIMKSIFEGRTFKITEYGIIAENKK